MAKYITEVLKEINDNPSLLTTTYKRVGDGGPLAKIFWCAFMADGKFLLPEGEPPFKPAPEPMGMTPARFITEVRRFEIFFRRDISNIKRETAFIQMLEGIHPDEAKIVIAIKDQQLTKLYPNITREAVVAGGYIPKMTTAEVKVEEQEVKKSSRPRGRPRKSPSPQPAL